MISLLISLCASAFAGWCAAELMKLDSSSFVRNCILGMCGGFIFSLIAGLFGIGSTNIIGSTIFSIIGACLLVILYGKYANR